MPSRASDLIEKKKKNKQTKPKQNQTWTSRIETREIFPFLDIRLLPAEERIGKETESATSNSLIHL